MVTIPLWIILVPLVYLIGGLITIGFIYLIDYSYARRHGLTFEETLATLVLWPVVWITTPFVLIQKWEKKRNDNRTV